MGLHVHIHPPTHKTALEACNFGGPYPCPPQHQHWNLAMLGPTSISIPQNSTGILQMGAPLPFPFPPPPPDPLRAPSAFPSAPTQHWNFAMLGCISTIIPVPIPHLHPHPCLHLSTPTLPSAFPSPSHATSISISISIPSASWRGRVRVFCPATRATPKRGAWPNRLCQRA